MGSKGRRCWGSTVHRQALRYHCLTFPSPSQLCCASASWTANFAMKPGLGEQPFHGNIALVVDRHTASAAEMIVAFARENNLATIVGEKTAGRLLSATSAKVGQGFRLALPTGAYYTWRGSVLE